METRKTFGRVASLLFIYSAEKLFLSLQVLIGCGPKNAGVDDSHA
jgi:hypothetical protein